MIPEDYSPDEEQFEEDELDEDLNLEQCDSCGRTARCEHMDGFGRTRIICRECLDDIFG